MIMTMESNPEFLSQSVDVKEPLDYSKTAEEEIDNYSGSHSMDGSDSSNRVSQEPASPNDDDEESESESEEEGEDHGKEEAMPDGDSNADLHALLAFSKSRLQKAQAPELPTVVNEPAEVTDDEESVASEGPSRVIEEVHTVNTNGTCDAAASPNNDEASSPVPTPVFSNKKHGLSEEEQLELAKKKMLEAELKAKADDAELELMEIAEEKLRIAEQKARADDPPLEKDPAYLLKLAEKKVKEAEEKARKDEEATGENILKPTVTTNRRSEENAELWALLNYSKRRLETGSTPQLGRKAGSVKDDMSVSSKRSQTSKKSISSKKSIASRSMHSGMRTPVSEVGLNKDVFFERKGGDDGGKGGAVESNEVPFPDVKKGDASDDESLESGMKSSSDEENDESYHNESEDDDEDDDSEEDEDDEDDLPDFLKSDSDDVDPEETKKRIQEARSFGASILGLADDKLTDVQMLQAIAVAEEAARNGDEKFTTKSSLFRLHEAKMEDLKALLDFGRSGKKEKAGDGESRGRRESVGWGLGQGRLVKKLGAVYQDFKERCDAIDEKKMLERQGRPTNSEILSAALLDLKRQIDEYDKGRRDSTQENK